MKKLLPVLLLTGCATQPLTIGPVDQSAFDRDLAMCRTEIRTNPARIIGGNAVVGAGKGATIGAIAHAMMASSVEAGPFSVAIPTFSAGIGAAIFAIDGMFDGLREFHRNKQAMLRECLQIKGHPIVGWR